MGDIIFPCNTQALEGLLAKHEAKPSRSAAAVASAATPQRALPPALAAPVGSGKAPMSRESFDRGDSDEEWINEIKSSGATDVGKLKTPGASVASGLEKPPQRGGNMGPYEHLSDSEKKKISEWPDRQPGVDSPMYSPSIRSETSADGTVKYQPVVPEQAVVPEYQAEPFEGEITGDIPDIRDALAERPRVGEHHLSPEAIRSRTKRIFTPRADGSKKVSEEIWNDWKAKGPRKRLLEDIFKRCGYDPETCFINLVYFCFSY